jgi:hypothetical protein
LAAGARPAQAQADDLGLIVRTEKDRAMVSSNRSLEASLFDRRFIKWVAGVLVALLGLLVIGDVLFVIVWPEASNFVSFQVNVDNEGNWSTWFNSTIDLFVGVAAFIVAWLKSREPRAPGRRYDVMGWILSGCVFVLLGMDDASQLHDSFSAVVANAIYAVRIGIPIVQELRYYMWIPLLGIPGIAVTVLMGIFFYRNLWRVPAARWLALAGIVLFLSNPVVEVFESKIILDTNPESIEELYFTDLTAWRTLQVLTLIQETTEIGAVICFLIGFMLFGGHLVGNEVTGPEALPLSAARAVDEKTAVSAR